MLLDPFLQYLLFGYYTNDNFEKVFSRPSLRMCSYFKNDCIRVLEMYSNSIKYIDKCRMISLHVVSFALQNILTAQDIIYLQQCKKMRINVLHFIRCLVHYGRELCDIEQTYFAYLIEIIFSHQINALFSGVFLVDHLLQFLTEGKMRVIHHHLLINHQLI